MEIKLKSTSPVIKKADFLNLYLEQNGFDVSRKGNGEWNKPVTCTKSIELDGERVTEWYTYTQDS